MKLVPILAALSAACCSWATQASTLPLAADGQWVEINMDGDVSHGSPLDWIDIDTLSPGWGTATVLEFAIPQSYVGYLTVVDAAFAGETFNVFNGATLLGTTSATSATEFDASAPSVLDFDAALADSSYSRSVFTLSAGHYQIHGQLAKVLLLDGTPMPYNVGGVKLEVSAVPEPASLTLALAGLGLAALSARRSSKKFA